MSRYDCLKDTTLQPFQIEACEQITALSGRALLADDCGLGKTIEILAWIAAHATDRHEKCPLPAIVLCPSNVKYKWAAEITRRTNIECMVLEGETSSPLPAHKPIIFVCNYDILFFWSGALRRTGVALVIADECHELADPATRKTKAFTELASTAKFLICASATPIKKAPVDFFPVLHMLKPDIFPSRGNYVSFFCKPGLTRYGVDEYGADNLEVLYAILVKHIMIRRLKTVLAKKINITETVFSVDITNRIEYNKICQEETGGAYAKLRECLGRGKLKAVISWADKEIIAGRKIVLMCWHKSVVDALYARYKKWGVKIDGACPAKKKYEYANKFNTDRNTLVCIGNIRSCGVGGELIGAKTCAFVELHPADYAIKQGKDRLDRISQKSSQVDYFYFIARDTIEEGIVRLVDGKKVIFNAAVNGRDTSEEELLYTLYANKPKGE